MGFTNLNKNRPILITGKEGTGKSTKALTYFTNPVIVYADEMDIDDWKSLSIDAGIIIEDVHLNPKKDIILEIIRRYRGQIVLTSLNEKSVPNEIKSMCQIKRAGSTQWTQLAIKDIAPRCEEPINIEMDTYSLVMKYLKDTNRDEIANLLKVNKPADVQILTWLNENMHPNKLIFVDGIVKRNWNQEYFYEMLAYAHSGNFYGKINMPKRGTYSKIPSLLKRLGIKNADIRIFKQLKQDKDFVNYAKTKLNNADCRILGLGEKKRRKKTDPIIVEVSSLEDYL